MLQSLFGGQENNETGTDKVFYGWYIVANCLVGMALGWSVITIFTFGLFVNPLSEEFGWGREAVSLGFSILSWTSILATFIFGGLADRFGVRRIMLPSILLFGIGVASLYYLTENLLLFYFILFSLVIIGGATSPVCYSRILVDWFNRRRGLALGIGLSGVGVGSAVVPAIVSVVIDQYGWRIAYLSMGAMVLFISLPITYLLMRNKPSDLGLNSDGDSDEAAASLASEDEKGVAVTEAIKQPVFWQMGTGIFLAGVSLSSVLAHQFPIMQDRGLDAGYIAIAAVLFGSSLMLGRILAGYLMDRYFAPRVAGVFLLAPVVGIAIYASGVSGFLPMLGAALIGMGIGVEFDVISFLASRYFGRLAYGKIYALLFAAYQCAAFGPWLMGYAFEYFGDYIVVLWVMSAVMLISAIFIYYLPPFPEQKIQKVAI